jgi:hypothetical protein
MVTLEELVTYLRQRTHRTKNVLVARKIGLCSQAAFACRALRSIPTERVIDSEVPSEEDSRDARTDQVLEQF